MASSGLLEDFEVCEPIVVPPRRLGLQDQKRLREAHAGGDEPVAKRRAVKPKKEVRPEDDWISLLGLPAPPVEKSEETFALPAPPEQDASAGSSGGVAVGDAVVALEPPAGTPGDGASVPPLPSPPVVRVEDHIVQTDGHGGLDRPGSYRRVEVGCSFHEGCEAQRSFSEKLASESGLGDQEPYTFLGVWLRKGRDCETAGEHMEYRAKIKASDLRAYAAALGWRA